MVAMRKIIKIDEDLCNGCGACVPGCAEGALQIVNGKARLVKEQYCDGLGACLGECPTGALSIEERESHEFDERATNEWLKSIGREPIPASSAHAEHRSSVPHTSREHGGGCPGSRMMTFSRKEEAINGPIRSSAGESHLQQWPVQLILVPASAPFLQESDLLIAADCVPFAYPDFHRKLLKGRSLVIACPKLDDAEQYVEKLSRMIKLNNFRSITIAHMEVPCCFGLGRIVAEAMKRADIKVPVMDVTVGIQGDLR